MDLSESSQRPVAADHGADLWSELRRLTPARIALGRAGGSLRTRSQLEFRLAHARARDAVHARFHAESIAEQLRREGIESARLSSGVSDRGTYLLRPDLGRRLSDESRDWLQHQAPGWGRRDLAVLVSDGLAAPAAENHAVATIAPLLRELAGAGWTTYPVFLVPLARVKLQDEVGELLGARLSVMFLGERPGLSASDSLGAYFTFGPGARRTDAERNCVSNIRTEGLPPALAARKLASLLRESRRRALSGVALKESAPSADAGSISGRSGDALQ